MKCIVVDTADIGPVIALDSDALKYSPRAFSIARLITPVMTTFTTSSIKQAKRTLSQYTILKGVSGCYITISATLSQSNILVYESRGYVSVHKAP